MPNRLHLVPGHEISLRQTLRHITLYEGTVHQLSATSRGGVSSQCAVYKTTSKSTTNNTEALPRVIDHGAADDHYLVTSNLRVLDLKCH